MPPQTTDKKPRLSADRIVDVALGQLRERGYEAVTMRSIAAELGTGPASLYAHVANRNELDALVVDRVVAGMQVPAPDPGRWDDQVRQIAHGMLEAYRNHPGTARCAMGNVPTSMAALTSIEAMFAIFRAGGIADQDASWFADQLSLYVASYAVEEDIWKARAAVEDRGADEIWDHIPAVFANLSAEEFPVLTSMGEALTSGDGDQRFGFAIDLMIQGLKARKG